MTIPQYDLDGLGGEFKVTKEVEDAFAKFFGVKHCVLVTSGTAALFLALRAVGAKKVAIPALTMFGTATAAELAGCELVFVSNNEIPEGVDTYLHVSLNGRDCGIEEVIRAHPDLTVIEDACQSFGSMHNGKYLGTFGKAGCFSFSPHKIISAGNGGCVITDDDAIALAVRKLKNFGRESGGGDIHEEIGYNFKFTDIQAAFMLPQFRAVQARLDTKKRIYRRYYDALKDSMRPHTGTPWFVDLYVDDPDGLAAHVAAQGIGMRKMYPLLTTQKPFSQYKIYGDSTADASYATRGLWLPSSLSLSDEDIDTVIRAIQSWK